MKMAEAWPEKLMCNDEWKLSQWGSSKEEVGFPLENTQVLNNTASNSAEQQEWENV